MDRKNNWYTSFQKECRQYDSIPKAHRDAMMAYFQAIDASDQVSDDNDILLTVDYLLADHLELDDDSIAASLRQRLEDEGWLPSDDMYTTIDTRRAAIEMLLLFPLRSKDITDMVNVSYGPEAATAWYYNTAAAILERTNAQHEACGYEAQLHCRYSVQCPRRVVAQLLEPLAPEENAVLRTIDTDVDVSGIKERVALALR